METLSSKLRAEIQEEKKMRHDFVLKKFSFLTIMSGSGALTDKLPTGIDLTWLLLLVPIVAIAFDFYITTTDYRIKRAGKFLQLKASSDEEKEWEIHCKNHPNYLSTAAFAFVTLIYLFGAGFILKQDAPPEMQNYLWIWFSVVILIELCLVVVSSNLRKVL